MSKKTKTEKSIVTITTGDKFAAAETLNEDGIDWANCILESQSEKDIIPDRYKENSKAKPASEKYEGVLRDANSDTICETIRHLIAVHRRGIERVIAESEVNEATIRIGVKISTATAQPSCEVTITYSGPPVKDSAELTFPDPNQLPLV
jgi:hypothetical protein